MLSQLSKRSLKALNAINSCQLSVTSFQLRVTLVTVPFAVSATETLFN